MAGLVDLLILGGLLALVGSFFFLAWRSGVLQWLWKKRKQRKARAKANAPKDSDKSGGCFGCLIDVALSLSVFIMLVMRNANLVLLLLAALGVFWFISRMRQGKGVFGKLLTIVSDVLNIVLTVVVLLPLLWVGVRAKEEYQYVQYVRTYNLYSRSSGVSLSAQVQPWFGAWLVGNNVHPDVWAAAVRASQYCRSGVDGRPVDASVKGCIRIDPFTMLGQKSAESGNYWESVEDPTVINRTGSVTCTVSLADRWSADAAALDTKSKSWQRIAQQPGLLETYGSDLHAQAMCSPTADIGATQGQMDVFEGLMRDLIDAHYANPLLNPFVDPWDVAIAFEFTARHNAQRSDGSRDGCIATYNPGAPQWYVDQATGRANELELAFHTAFPGKYPSDTLVPLDQLVQLPSGEFTWDPAKVDSPLLPAFMHKPYAGSYTVRRIVPGERIPNSWGVHGNADYVDVESWNGTDVQAQDDRTIVAMFPGIAIPGEDGIGGYYVLVKGTGVWSHWVARYLHLENVGRADGAIDMGGVIGQENVSFVHTHLVLMWCADPDSRASGCVDVPFLSTISREDWPSDFYPGNDNPELALPADTDLWTPLGAVPPSWEHETWGATGSPGVAGISSTGVSTRTLLGDPVLDWVAEVASLGWPAISEYSVLPGSDPRVAIDDQTGSLDLVFDTQKIAAFVPSLGSDMKLIVTIVSTESLYTRGLLAQVVPPVDLVRDPAIEWIVEPRQKTLAVVVPLEAAELWATLGLKDDLDSSKAFEQVLAFGLETAENLLSGKSLDGDVVWRAAQARLVSAGTFKAGNIPTLDELVVLPRLLAIWQDISALLYHILDLLLVALQHIGVAQNVLPEDVLEAGLSILNAPLIELELPPFPMAWSPDDSRGTDYLWPGVVATEVPESSVAEEPQLVEQPLYAPDTVSGWPLVPAGVQRVITGTIALVPPWEPKKPLPVVATLGGEVSLSGQIVRITNAHTHVVVQYSGLSSIAVKDGDIVRHGDVLGYADASGIQYSVLVNDAQVDPVDTLGE